MDVYGYNLTNGQASTTTVTISNMEGDPKSDEDANFFFLNEAKALPFQLIKKKRVAQLIKGKPG
jgi:hypothetical protein